MISDEQIRRVVEYLSLVTFLIMPDRIRTLSPLEQDKWVRETVRQCLRVSRETRKHEAKCDSGNSGGALWCTPDCACWCHGVSRETGSTEVD